MKFAENYLTEDRVLSYLCRFRAKLAKTRNRAHLVYQATGNPKFKPDTHPLRPDEELLCSLLPNRRQWKKLGQNPRRSENGQPLNSTDKNVCSLLMTVAFCKKQRPEEPFLRRLDDFTREVLALIRDGYRPIATPEIFPKLKDDKKSSGNSCRPISAYPLADKIAICLANQYLTDFFDPCFRDCSFAFRARREIDGKPFKPTHHDAFQKIVDYRRRQGKKRLWVAECDIQKFFDTVNHSVIKKAFKRMAVRADRHNGVMHSREMERVFFAYLASYRFNKHVAPLVKKGQAYFDQFDIPDGNFGNVQETLKNAGIYRSFNNARFGIAQGGALSGFIANLVLHEADDAMLRDDDLDLLYVRYCDDMIIMHPNRQKCRSYMRRYERALRRLKLLPHDSTSTPAYGKAFWDQKSKPPYSWSASAGIPWIGFVGYEINVGGDIRVRKRSLVREMRKQYATVREVLGALRPRLPRATNKTIEESITNRLIQMSVGKVRLHNYDKVQNELCWVSGFRLLNDNKYSRIQLKRLDRCRNRLIRKIGHQLRRTPAREPPPKGGSGRNRQLVYYGRPFSYYHQALKKRSIVAASPLALLDKPRGRMTS
ncbi:MAG: hypothetical protein KA248_10695 [Kiritimatiellae bacterium]|nr:hypothetical protein [Kiritimatiellia bacterium]